MKIKTIIILINYTEQNKQFNINHVIYFYVKNNIHNDPKHTKQTLLAVKTNDKIQSQL